MKRTPLKRKTPLRSKRPTARGRPDAFDLGPKVKADRFAKMLEATSTRRVGRHTVYVPEDGTKPFIVVTRTDGRRKRRPGEFRRCAKCDREYFWQGGARPSQVTCSRRCASYFARKVKRANALARGGPNRDALDRWFSLIVRSVGRCYRCGTDKRLQCAHILSRRYLGIRFAFDNALCLCASCHVYFTHRPLEWEIYIDETCGRDRLPDLKKRALAFQGPLDRVAVATTLYARAEELDLAMHYRGWRPDSLPVDPETE